MIVLDILAFIGLAFLYLAVGVVLRVHMLAFLFWIDEMDKSPEDRRWSFQSLVSRASDSSPASKIVQIIIWPLTFFCCAVIGSFLLLCFLILAPAARGLEWVGRRLP